MTLDLEAPETVDSDDNGTMPFARCVPSGNSQVGIERKMSVEEDKFVGVMKTLRPVHRGWRRQ